MTTEQVITGKSTMWPHNRPATEDLSDVFSHMVIKDLIISGDLDIIVSVITPVFNWEAAEKRADWEKSHGRFVEFSDVKDLLSNLHS